MSNFGNGEKFDRKSVVRSSAPMRKSRIPAEFSVFTESQPNNKFLDLIQYYEHLAVDKNKPVTSKDKNTVSCSSASTPDIPEYESSSVDSRSIYTPDFMNPGLPKSTSSVLSESESGSRNESPDLGYTSITKQGLQGFGDNTTSDSGSRNISPEYGYRDMLQNGTTEVEFDDKFKTKPSISPDLGYEATPEKTKFNNYTDMRYLLDFKIPHSSDSETNSFQKFDEAENTVLHKKPSENLTRLQYNLQSKLHKCSNDSADVVSDCKHSVPTEKKKSFKCSLSSNSALQNNNVKHRMTAEETSLNCSHNSKDLSLKTLFKKYSVLDQKEDLEKKQSLENLRTLEDKISSAKSSLINVFEYTRPTSVSPDYAPYKLAFDVSESDFSENVTLQDESEKELFLHDSFHTSNENQNHNDTIIYNNDLSITQNNSQEYLYDGIMDIHNNYIYQHYDNTENHAHNNSRHTPDLISFGSESKLDDPINMFTQSKNANYSTTTGNEYPDYLFNRGYEVEPGKNLLDLSFDLRTEIMQTYELFDKSAKFKDEIEVKKLHNLNNHENDISLNELDDEAEVQKTYNLTNYEDDVNQKSDSFNISSNLDYEINTETKTIHNDSYLEFEQKSESEIFSDSLNKHQDQDHLELKSFDTYQNFGRSVIPETYEPRSDSRLSETFCQFGQGRIPETYNSPTCVPEIRSRFSLRGQSTLQSLRGCPDLINPTYDRLHPRYSLDSTLSTKIKPLHNLEFKFSTSGYKYPLPKPSDFLPDVYSRREITPSRLNTSNELSESKRAAMYKFMSTCINQEPSYDTLPESGPSCLPSTQKKKFVEKIENHHKMKIDLRTVDYIMNNRRKSLKRNSIDCSGEFTDDENVDDQNYSIASIIGALDELGIEVEFDDQDEQHRRRTIGRNTSLMESVREENESELKENTSHQTKVQDENIHFLNEIKEVNEFQDRPEIDILNKSFQSLNENEEPNIQDDSFELNKNEITSGADDEKQGINDNSVTVNSPVKTIPRPESPVIASSQKLKHLHKYSLNACKINLISNFETPKNRRSSEVKNSLESTKKHISESSFKICKLDNSISTISMSPSIESLVHPILESKYQDLIKNKSIIDMNLRDETIRSEFDKLKVYAKSAKSAKEQKNKRNSLTAKYKKSKEDNEETSDSQNTPSAVEHFLSDALGSDKDEYETTTVDESMYANTNEIDSNLFTDETDSNLESDVPQQLNRSASNLTLSAKALIKSAASKIKKKKLEAKQWNELKEEMNVLLESEKKPTTMIQQASKALKVCYSFKEFKDREEHVESERILLLVHQRKSVALEAIEKFTGEPKLPKVDNYGDIMLNNIVLPLNTHSENKDKNQKQNSKHEFVEWYMVLVKCGLTVLGTQPMLVQKDSTEIVFPDKFVIPKVGPDFKINFEVYRLKLKKKGDISHELKYRIRGSYSLADAWYKTIGKFTQRSHSSKEGRLQLKRMFESSFMCIGQLELTLKDLSVSSPWTLEDAQPLLKGIVNMTLFCKVDLTDSLAGWLTHGTDLRGYPVWNRRWCVLIGHVLKFWDYPSDDPQQEPIMTLDLMNCKDSEVGIVSRELCAKPRTIMIEFTQIRDSMEYDSVDDSNTKEQRNFLTLDTNRELNEWLTKINKILRALNNWNVKQ